VRAAVFDKLVPAIGDCRRLFLALDGELARLPFEVLPTEDHRFLIDNYHFSYLNCGREVLRFGMMATVAAERPLVAADPDFDLRDGEARGMTADAVGRQSRDLDRRASHFGRLPGTREEGVRLAEMLHVEPLVEDQVLEADLKRVRSPRILHIATHGFFLADQERDLHRGDVVVGAGAGQLDALAARLSGVENPLLRSGVVLAGANTWLAGDPLPADAEDGLLTAEDVSGLDLLATELVVLSACETGRGDVHVGEGVLGLRRAFGLAGARSLVTSLWKVPDEETKELMIDFYQRIVAGEACGDALHAAQAAMKSRSPHPYYWGAFVCHGDPTW
jgi:CHAT domain-containing protein